MMIALPLSPPAGLSVARLRAWVAAQNLFETMKVMSPTETIARQEVMWTHYSGIVEIEAKCAFRISHIPVHLSQS